MADSDGNNSDAANGTSSNSANNGSTTGSSNNGTGLGDGTKGGGSSDSDANNGNNTNNSTSNNAPAVDATTTTSTGVESENVSGYSFSKSVDASLSSVMAGLNLSKDSAQVAAETASFGAMPATLGDIATETAVGHFGFSALTGAMAGYATNDLGTGLTAGLNALSDPASIATAMSNIATKGLGMNSTAHDVGGMVGRGIGAMAVGPVGAVIGGLLGKAVVEGFKDATQSRDNEMARDIMEKELGPIGGRVAAAEMSDLGFAGFNRGLNDPSLGHLGGYTAGVIGQAEAIANAAMNLGDPTAGIGVSTTSISGMDTSTNPGMDISSEIGATVANANDALATAAIAPDRSSELGWGDVAPSVSAQEASMEALGGSTNFIPTQSYGWLRAGLPVAAPSSTYRSSYWDGTRFVNMNDYRGYM